MDIQPPQESASKWYHFSKKVFLISFIFIILNVGWYLLFLFSQKASYLPVSPQVFFHSEEDVQIKTLYSDSFEPLKDLSGKEYLLTSGSQLKTGPLSSAEIILEDNLIQLSEDTTITLLENNFSGSSAKNSPRLLFRLDGGVLRIKAVDSIEIRTPKVHAHFLHSVGSFSYASTMNRLMAFSGTIDLSFYSDSEEYIADFTVPLENQVVFADSQIIPDYALLTPSKLKKEIKASSIPAPILKDDTVQLLIKPSSYQPPPKNSLYFPAHLYYKIRSFLTFSDQSRLTFYRAYLQDRFDDFLNYDLSEDYASQALADLRTIISSYEDPSSFLNVFYQIGPRDYNSSAYELKDYFRTSVFNEDTSVCQTYLEDISFALGKFDLKNALLISKAWSHCWDGKLNEAHFKEYRDQLWLFNQLIVAYRDRIAEDLLLVFDQSSDRLIDFKGEDQDAFFSITEQHLNIAIALMDVYRYNLAKKYLNSAYDSLEADNLSYNRAAKALFVEQVRLLAERIDYAETYLNGAAKPIDETEFRIYVQRKKRDDLISKNLKMFLNSDNQEDLIKTESPSASDISGRFAQARISVIEEDVTPFSPDYPFMFNVKNARLIDRASDGSSVVFNAVYDYTTNGVNDLVVNDESVRGHFELSDLVSILTQPSQESDLPNTTSLEENILPDLEFNDEERRAQIVAQDMAIQLAVGEIREAGIQITSPDMLEILDDINLNLFNVKEAFIPTFQEDPDVIQIRFKYRSSSKIVSELIFVEADYTSPSPVPLSQVASLVRSVFEKQNEEKVVLDTFKTSLPDLGLDPDGADFTLKNGYLIDFTDLKFTHLPLAFSGEYNTRQKTLTNEDHTLQFESYLENLTQSFVQDYLSEKGILVPSASIHTQPPFDSIEISDYLVGNESFNFTLDIENNRLKDVTLYSTGSQIASMTFSEFLRVMENASESVSESDEEIEIVPVEE